MKAMFKKLEIRLCVDLAAGLFLLLIVRDQDTITIGSQTPGTPLGQYIQTPLSDGKKKTLCDPVCAACAGWRVARLFAGCVKR